jgi:hypothetical protein
LGVLCPKDLRDLLDALAKMTVEEKGDLESGFVLVDALSRRTTTDRTNEQSACVVKEEEGSKAGTSEKRPTLLGRSNKYLARSRLPAAIVLGRYDTNSLCQRVISIRNWATAMLSGSPFAVPRQESLSHASAVGWPRDQPMVERTWPSI